MDLKKMCQIYLAILVIMMMTAMAAKRGKDKDKTKDKDKDKTEKKDQKNEGHDFDFDFGKRTTSTILTGHEIMHRIVNDMLEGYDRQQSPHGENATTVKLGIYINSFYSINEQTMDYSVNIYLRQTWYDPRLEFTPTDGLSEQMIKLEDGKWDELWVPDVFFRNEKSASFHHVTIPNRLMRLYNTGKIWYAMKISARLACSFRLHKYPHDTQECPMLLESFGYTSETVVFKFLDDRNPVAFDDMALELPQFSLNGDPKLKDCSTNYSTGAYPCLQIKFILKRDIGYYLIQVYVPSILIVILSWVAFWINIEAIPARVSLGLLTVLTMTTQSSGARQGLPRVSYIKAIDVWMSMCLVFVFTSLLEFAVVNVFSRKEIKLKSMPDPETIPMGEMSRLVNIIVENGKEPRHTKTMIPDPDGKTKARRIDKLSRRLFPMAFLIFNVIYWVFYLVI
ncbi:glycine receptor subunit beta-like isoform X3 [Lineus longissimus]|uniref:glycine receptor subunit beta-like isoform X3 n=1 Tax=Lineus longissimus TaxID=88925 RepID=UPI00315C8E13